MSLRTSSSRRSARGRILARSIALVLAVGLAGATGVLGASAATRATTAAATTAPTAAPTAVPSDSATLTSFPASPGVDAPAEVEPTSSAVPTASAEEASVTAESVIPEPAIPEPSAVQQLKASAPVPAAASSGTFTVTGTVQAEARAATTVLSAVWVATTKKWATAAKAVVVNAKTGAFTVTLPAGASRYTLFFETGHVPFFDTALGGGDSLAWADASSSGVFSGAKGTTKSLGQIKLTPAGVIEGVITDTTGAALTDVVVYGSPRAENQPFSTTANTEAGGKYYLKVERNMKYDVIVSGDTNQDTWYPGTENPDESTPVLVTAATSFHATGINFAVDLAKPSVWGYFDPVDDEEESDQTDGPFTGPTVVEVSIYALVNGVVSSVPVQTSAGGEFEFRDLEAGNYAIAFRDAETHAWVPALFNNGSPQVGSVPRGGSVAGDGCLVPLTLVRGQIANLGFFRMGDTAKSVCTAPWGAGAAFSGTVTHWTPGDATEAGLYYATSDATAVEVDRTAVSATGSYSFPAITRAGRYFVGVTAGEAAPYFDTAQGGYPYHQYEFSGGETSETSTGLTGAIAHAPVIAATTPSAGNDVTLIGAVIVKGTVVSGSKPVADAEVFSSVGEPGRSQTESAFTDKSGHYALKMHTSKGLTMGAAKTGYYTRYFHDTEDVTKATPVDFVTAGFDRRTINFSLRPTVTSLTFSVSPYPLNTIVLGDPDPLEGMTATLYLKSGSSWKKVDASSAQLVPMNGYAVSFPTAGVASLKPGSYHVRFSIGKRWLPITGYRLDQENDSVEGTTCSVPVTLDKGTPKVMAVAVDFYSETTAKCTDEPTSASTVGAGSSESGSVGSGWPVSSSLLPEAGVTFPATPAPTTSPEAVPATAPTAPPTVTPEPSSSNGASVEIPLTASQNASSSGSLSWVIVVGALVLAAIVAGLIVMVVRRQAAAGK